MRYIIILILIINQAAGQVKYNLPCDAGLLEASLDTALAQQGITEASGRNDGPVLKYLRPLGLEAGNPYCAAGQYFCFLAAVRALNLKRKDIPIPASGLANDFMDYAIRNGKAAKFYPAKHDLIIWRKGKTIFGHVERIIASGERGWVHTIAFNTRSEGSATGIEGVFSRRRNIFHPLGRMRVRGLVGFIPIKSRRNR